MQRALVVLDDIFYCSVGNVLDRSETLGQIFLYVPDLNPRNVEDRSLQIRPMFCPLFIRYKYKTKITARLPECHIPNRRAVI